jgi:hypothetical protein
MTAVQAILQVRIELLGIEPPIWRRIEVPESCSFWDLHIAIQDAMGWSDSHLHQFRVVGSEAVFGMPDDDGEDLFQTQPGWKHRVREHLNWRAPIALYEYDFGDSWLHEVRLETIEQRRPRVRYPRCTAGARKCPPEDCGGTHGYQELLRVISSPEDEEYDSTIEWLGQEFDPEAFDPTAVRFQNPRTRWREVFTDAG